MTLFELAQRVLGKRRSSLQLRAWQLRYIDRCTIPEIVKIMQIEDRRVRSGRQIDESDVYGYLYFADQKIRPYLPHMDDMDPIRSRIAADIDYEDGCVADDTLRFAFSRMGERIA